MGQSAVQEGRHLVTAYNRLIIIKISLPLKIAIQGRAMIQAPDSLFKYLPPTRLDVLKFLRIRFTQASSQNDTLELRPPTKGVAEPETLAHIARERLKEAMWSMTAPDQKQWLDAKFPGLTEEIGEELLKQTTIKAVSSIERNYEQSRRKIFEVTDHNFGMLCLSEIPTDIRMWGHYADGGRGFLIEFDTKHPWFHCKREEQDSFRHLRRVRYESSRPATYLIETTEEDFLYTKWSAWRDEREWRIIRNFNDAAQKLGQPDAHGNEILLFSIPPESMKSVILGFSANPQFTNEIRETLHRNITLEHIKLRTSTQSRETGEIVISN
jgi:Protein of unknown function (DUF2971)